MIGWLVFGLCCLVWFVGICCAGRVVLCWFVFIVFVSFDWLLCCVVFAGFG